jgi:hypothetical protein
MIECAFNGYFCGDIFPAGWIIFLPNIGLKSSHFNAAAMG